MIRFENVTKVCARGASALSRERETASCGSWVRRHFFIQLPFMVEGAIAATVGALMAVVGLWVGVRFLIEDWLGQSSQWITT